MPKHPGLPNKLHRSIAAADSAVADSLIGKYRASLNGKAYTCEMTELNLFLHVELGMCLPTNTPTVSDPRRYLIRGVTEANWCQLFEQHLLNIVVTSWKQRNVAA